MIEQVLLVFWFVVTSICLIGLSKWTLSNWKNTDSFDKSITVLGFMALSLSYIVNANLAGLIK